MIQTIPLNKLVASKRNVRRQSDPLADAQLKADLQGRGLLQNLVVTVAAKPKGSFAVEAGGRRLAALKALAADGALPKDHGVPCLVLTDSGTDAAEASLAENFQRLAMNPADECLAFQALIELGSDVDGIARRFGLTTRFVEGRLRLANLAPVVFEALGRGEISLDIAKAYAVTADRERQALVFEQMARSYSSPHPDSIRRMMTQATVSGADPRARFVGEDAYLAAGGRVERDLFSDEASARWLDVAILERLATEKLDAAAATTATETGLAWVRPSLDEHVGWERTEGLRRLVLDAPEPTDDEKVEIERLEAEATDCQGVLEDEEATDEERAAADTRLDEIESRISALAEKPPVLAPEQRETAGTFLVLGRDGVPRLHSAFYAERAETPPEPAVGDAAAGEPAETDKPAALSQRLVEELAMQRRDILAAHVAADPDFALDLAIFLMADQQTGYRSERVGSSLRAAKPQDPVIGFKTPDAAASIERDRQLAALDRSWADGESLAARFDAFRQLPPDARAAWLGVLVAGTLEASANLPGQHLCRFHDHLAGLLGIDAAAWWRPTATGYFDRVTKPVMFDALRDVGGPVLAARYVSSKKADLAATCEKIFSGDFIGEVEVKAAAVAWVPDAMRFGPISPVEIGEPQPATEPEAAARAGKTTSSTMSQYLALKSEAGDALLLYRMGDFFELFFEDARTASQVLDIALTTRSEPGGVPVPMCGVPVHAATSYIAQLIKAGHRVAIAEPTETQAEAEAARGPGALVGRGIVRVVTAASTTDEVGDDGSETGGGDGTVQAAAQDREAA